MKAKHFSSLAQNPRGTAARLVATRSRHRPRSGLAGFRSAGPWQCVRCFSRPWDALVRSCWNIPPGHRKANYRAQSIITFRVAVDNPGPARRCLHRADDGQLEKVQRRGRITFPARGPRGWMA